MPAALDRIYRMNRILLGLSIHHSKFNIQAERQVHHPQITAHQSKFSIRWLGLIAGGTPTLPCSYQANLVLLGIWSLKLGVFDSWYLEFKTWSLSPLGCEFRRCGISR